VGHFHAVLESYPLMRRTMESVAAERWVCPVLPAFYDTEKR
jgi:hypothetical protein